MEQEVFEDTLKQLYEVRKGMQRKIKAQSERINQLEYEKQLNRNACSQLAYLRNKSINDDMRIDRLERIIVRLKKEDANGNRD